MSVPAWKRHLPKIVGTAIVAGIGIGVVWLIQAFMGAEPDKPKKQIQQITLLKPPPPPPPPPKVEQPPEPEIEEKVDVPEPEQLEDLPEMADEPPAGDLGLDAEGGAGSDGFGLVGRKGGRGLLAGDPHLIYASLLQRHIEDALLDSEAVRRSAYSVVVNIWVAPGGGIDRVELGGSSGDNDLDVALRGALESLQAFADVPPEGMPQPIKLRITSRL